MRAVQPASKASHLIHEARRINPQIAKRGLSDVKRTMKLAQPGAELPLGYLGFHGRGNAGDDSIFEAHSLALTAAKLRSIPLTKTRTMMSAASRLRNGPVINGIMLGGGTLVGRSAWRSHLEAANQFNGGPLIIAGAGVEDPAFSGAKSGHYTDADELKRWADIIDKSPLSFVRGPRSQQLLQELGVSVPFISDPALILSDISNLRPHSDALRIGVNIALPEDQYSNGGDRAYTATREALAALQARGWEVVLFPFEDRDVPLAQRLASQLRIRPAIFDNYLDVSALTAAIGKCTTFIGQRLHAVVLASAMFVPTLSLEYRPKCRDFQDSIGRGNWTVKTTECSTDILLDYVDQLFTHREAHKSELMSVVTEKRRALIDFDHRVMQLVTTYK